MKTLKMAKNIILFVIAIVVTSSCMAAGTWTKSYQAGTYEFMVEKQDLRLLVTCQTANNNPDTMSTISLYRMSTGKTIGKFQIVANGNTYNGPVDSESRAGANNFKGLMADLRKGDSVVNYALGSVTMPKEGASRVIPVAGDKFPCQTSF